MFWSKMITRKQKRKRFNLIMKLFEYNILNIWMLTHDTKGNEIDDKK